ncbi:MAG TPA: hypothetical protein VN631_00485 [Negativicutes bacterium]|nr:hypothetical protein [Negativicutes bacterium]
MCGDAHFREDLLRVDPFMGFDRVLGSVILMTTLYQRFGVSQLFLHTTMLWLNRFLFH